MHKQKPEQRLHQTRFDITLVVKDGTEFKAHRQALSEASSFFEKLLKSNMKESKEGVIRLEMLTEPQMADVLEFIYTGNIQISSQENAQNLIAVADYLFLSNLKHIAGKFLEHNLTTLNCFSTLQLAEKYLCDELIDSSLKFMCSNFTAITESDHFMNLPSNEVEKLISSDEIVITAEEDVFKVILRWIDHNQSERSVKFGELFRHVRLTFILRDFLISDVVTNDLVTGNDDCLDRVTEALAWIDRVPRPDSPRKALEMCVVAGCGKTEPLQTFLYVPEKDEFYCLPKRPRTDLDRRPEHVFPCRGRLFVVSQDIDNAQYYDLEANLWLLAPWTNKMAVNLELGHLSQRLLSSVLIVENVICFVLERIAQSSTWLWKYDLDADSFVSTMPRSWLQIVHSCLVVVGKFIYIIGGGINRSGSVIDEDFAALKVCARFDIKEHTEEARAQLKEYRFHAMAAARKGKIFVVGGYTGFQCPAKNCEVYDLETDEWHFFANLTVPRSRGNMLLLDETLYVLCGLNHNSEDEWTVEFFNQEENKWNVKTRFPAETWLMHDYFASCSFRLFRREFSHLEFVKF